LDYCDGCCVKELEYVSWESWSYVEEHKGGATTRGKFESKLSKVVP
jgi:hypothetical protein